MKKSFETMMFNLRPPRLGGPDETQTTESIIEASRENHRKLEQLGLEGWEIKAVINQHLFLQRELIPQNKIK